MKHLLTWILMGWGASLFATGFAYHGSLAMANGATFDLTEWDQRTDEERTFIFAMYTTPTGTEAPIWSATHTDVVVDCNGSFTVMLEEGVDDTENVADFFTVLSAHTKDTLYIGVTVGVGTKEISPRQEILTVPYVAYADYVEGEAYNFNAKQSIEVTSAFQSTGMVALETLDADSAVVSGRLYVGESITTETLNVTNDIFFTEHVSATTIEGYGAVPPGGIVPFFDKEIPTGWLLCDGKNNTPNLTDYFIMGYDESYAREGGASSVTLTTENIPQHKHTLEREIYSHLYDFWRNDKNDGNNRWRRTQDRSGYSSKGAANGTNLLDEPTPITTIPPFTMMRFIMREGVL